MKISTKSRYGLRAMFYLAKSGKICSAKEIARKEKIPFDFLEKIFSKLQKEGLIKSKRGIKGGYFLAKTPKRITVGEILKTLENKEIFSITCLKRQHLSKKKCPIRNVWDKILKVLNFTLEKITLADLIKYEKNSRSKKPLS